MAEEEIKSPPQEENPEAPGEETTEATNEEEKSEGPPNVVTIEDAGPCKKKVIIEVPEEKVKSSTDKQFEDLRKEALVPGFRKGRAPRRLLEKRFGKEASEQIKLTLLAEASEAAIKDNELDTLGEPDIDYENIELPEEGAFKFEFEVEVRPEFDLPGLEGIPVTKTMHEVTEEQIDGEVEQMQKWAGIWTPRDGAVEAEDQIIADAMLKIEEVEEPLKLDNEEIYVRHNGFVGEIPVENLDELLVGAKAGDTKQANIEVPQTYYKEEYRGKKVDITIDIKDVKMLKPAELDEGFFQRMGAENEKDLREKLREQLQGRLEGQIRTEMAEQIYEYLHDNTEFDLPLDVVAQQADTVLRRQYVNLLMKGFSREQVSSQMEQLQAGSEEQAKKQLKTFFIMDKIADNLEIEVSEEEINGHIAQLAIQRGQRPERLREQMEHDGSLAQFTLEVRQNKCIEKLLESANITEKKPSKKNAKKVQKTTKKTKKKKTAKKSDKKEAKTKEKES